MFTTFIFGLGVATGVVASKKYTTLKEKVTNNKLYKLIKRK